MSAKRAKKATPLERALAIRDPAKRCRALLTLLPKLPPLLRLAAARAAVAAANAIKDAKVRAALRQRVVRAMDDLGIREIRRPDPKPKKKRAASKAGVPSMLGGGPRTNPRAKKKAAAKVVKKKGRLTRKSSKRGAAKPPPKRGAAKPPPKRGPAKPRSKRGAAKPPPKRGAAKPRSKRGAAKPPRKSPSGLPAQQQQNQQQQSFEADRPAVVNLGFSHSSQPDYPVERERALAPGETYYFWLEVGDEIPGSIAETPAELPIDELPSTAKLSVMLFTNEGGFALKAVPGWLQLHEDGSVDVANAADVPDLFNRYIASKRLFFEVRTPKKPGTYRLRCCICFKGALVQSYDIEALVDDDTNLRRPVPALVSRMDYTLSSRLDRQTLSTYGEHRLTIMLNDDGKGTHGFRFMGAGTDYYQSTAFDGQEVQDIVSRTRRALRRASWGSEEAWKPGDAYLYEQDAQLAQLTTDLARLAIAGYRNYDVIASRLGDDAASALRDLMRTPGTVQLALKETARLVLPLALLYDHTLDTDGDLSEYTLCKEFVRSTSGSLDDHPCFRGDCPHRDARGSRVVCPSGFWGYRHQLGVPPSLGSTAGSPVDLPGVLDCPGDPAVVVSVSTDPAMRERDEHVRAIKELFKAANVTYAETRVAILENLRSARAHIAYFYGHGGVDDGVPYMQVGAPNERISRATLRAEKVVWTDPRSLVFLNGCHTTDLEPERAIELVSGFVQTSHGAGVIGTEITVFEPLATTFAEVFMSELAKRNTVGESVRRARLRLLEKWNPLGLVYVPYALASLRLS